MLELAQKKMHVDDEPELYVMPTSVQVGVTRLGDGQTADGHEILNRDLESMKQRYVQEKRRVSEQDEWETIQRGMTEQRVGAEDRPVQGSEYELIQQDEIEFVESLIDKGINVEQLIRENKQRDEAIAHASSEFEKIQIQRASLPVTRCRDQILEFVEKNNIIIVEAETGSGKTTQIPQFLHDAGYSKKGIIGCTQPRRVACMEVSSRVAQEMGVKLGNEVGYSVRFENKTNDRTVIKYLTDGMLLREFLTEPDLASYSVMIIDEAHERSLHTDILLGLIKDVSRARDDLKIIISSATMDSEKFSQYFDDAPILSVGSLSVSLLDRGSSLQRHDALPEGTRERLHRGLHRGDAADPRLAAPSRRHPGVPHRPAGHRGGAGGSAAAHAQSRPQDQGAARAPALLVASPEGAAAGAYSSDV